MVEGKAHYGGRTLAEWCPEAVAAIVSALHPREIIIFGSVARGDDGPDSDIDVLVVLDKAAPGRKREYIAVARAAIEAPIPLDVLITDPKEMAERGDLPGILRVARREGRCAYARPG